MSSIWGSIAAAAINAYANKNSGSSGSNSSSSDGYSDIFKALLGGIGGSADAKLAAEMYKVKAQSEGEEQRKSSLFEYQLKDYYTQQDKVRKRAALDTYGQFSQISKWAPNYVPNNPTITTPALPDPKA